MSKSRRLPFFLMTAAIFVGSGCAFNVKPVVSPAINIYSSYEDKIPGTFILILDSTVKSCTRDVRASTHFCSGHTYPVDIGEPLSVSIERTMQSIFEIVILKDSVPVEGELNELNAQGFIVVRLDHFQPRLSFTQGMWTNRDEATSDLSLGITIQGRNGPLLGASAGASRTVQHDAANCPDGAIALSEAISLSIKEAMERMAEKVTNSQKLREYTRN